MWDNRGEWRRVGDAGYANRAPSWRPLHCAGSQGGEVLAAISLCVASGDLSNSLRRHLVNHIRFADRALS